MISNLDREKTNIFALYLYFMLRNKKHKIKEDSFSKINEEYFYKLLQNGEYKAFGLEWDYEGILKEDSHYPEFYKNEYSKVMISVMVDIYLSGYKS